MAQDSGLVKRGMLLFASIAILAVAVGFMLFRRTPSAPLQELPRPEPYVASLTVPAAGFPGAVNWPALAQLSSVLPAPPGWEIRYTATQVLANRGHPKTPLDVLREMLDEDQQRRNHRMALDDGKIVVNEAGVQQVLFVALKAIQQWHKKPEAVAAADKTELRRLHDAVEKLANHPNNAIKNEALQARVTIQASK